MSSSTPNVPPMAQAGPSNWYLPPIASYPPLRAAHVASIPQPLSYHAKVDPKPAQISPAPHAPAAADFDLIANHNEAEQQYQEEATSPHPAIPTAGGGFTPFLRFQRRGASSSKTPVYRQDTTIGSDGFFNGSCAHTSREPIETPRGSCSSYIPDVTVYCCSGIGGQLEEVTWSINDGDMTTPAASATGSGISSSNSTSSSGNSTTSGTDEALMTEPICLTTSYTDALACFRLTAESHCKSATASLYGMCNGNGTQDTSTQAATLSNSGSGSSTLGAGQWRVTVGMMGCMVATAVLASMI